MCSSDHLLRRTCHRSVPHLVTVLGKAGIGKTRLLMEFERRASDVPAAPKLLVDRVLPTTAAGDGELAPFRQLLLSYCGIDADEPHETALDKLGRAVERAVGEGEQATRLMSTLAPLVAADNAEMSHYATERVLDAWREFLIAAAREQPLVLILDDLHAGSDAVVDGIEQLASSSSSVPLLVVASARPQLLLRYPGWGLGTRHFSTVTLEVPSDAATELLVTPLGAGGRVAGPNELPSLSRPSARPSGTAQTHLGRNSARTLLMSRTSG